MLHQAAERRGSLVSRVTSDVDTMSTYMQWGGLLILVSAAQLSLATVLMLFWSWQLTLVVYLCFLPLVFAAELVQRRNIDLYRENDGAIGRLANLVIDAVEDPASFTKITPVKQDLFPWTFRDELSWVEPYYARFHDRRLPAIIAPRRPFSEWRLGGDVTAAWGAPLP